MSKIKEWLLESCNEDEWSPLSVHSNELENKIIRVNNNNDIRVGVIVEYHDNFNYSISFNGKIERVNLENLSCYIKNNITTNRDFCLAFGDMFLNYIKKSKDMELDISDKDFLKSFVSLVYYNSGL